MNYRVLTKQRNGNPYIGTSKNDHFRTDNDGTVAETDDLDTAKDIRSSEQDAEKRRGNDYDVVIVDENDNEVVDRNGNEIDSEIDSEKTEKFPKNKRILDI